MRILLLLLLLIPVFLFSQTGSISGRLVDSLSHKSMPLATIAVFHAKDTTLITYRMSAGDGSFKVPGLPVDQPLRLIISYSGYAVHRQEFVLTAARSQEVLGTIAMLSDVKSLDEVLVLAERPPVVIRKDTIEFNASSFKTLPTALVEDLLKKLPGVQLDPDGNITVNGRRVNRILVDGREFFGGDTRMATKNLPANIVDKVQVMNDSQEMEEFPDKAKASLGQVINLRLKKGIKQGWFGKAYAGGGTDNRYEAGAIINSFRDTLQLSVLGFSNNLNRAGFGFSDIRKLGGFDRSGVTSVSSANGGLSINGISFGGTGEGIQQSDGVGFNLNNVFKKKITLNTQYFYGQSKNDIVELNNRQQFLGDTVLVTRSGRNELIKTFTHRVSFSLKIPVNAFTRIDFRPGFVIADQRSNRLLSINTTSNKDGLLNTSNNNQVAKGEDIRYTHILNIARTFRKKGRTLGFYQVANYNHTDNDQVNDVRSIFYPDDTLYLDQLRNRAPSNTTINTTITYHEPLAKGLKLRLIYGLNYLRNKDELTTYDKNNFNGKYEAVNAALTSKVTRTGLRNNLSAALVWSFKDLVITGSANAQRLDLTTDLQTSNNKFTRHYNYLFPGIAIDWKELSVEYSASVIPPGIADVQPVPDNTNTLYIINGNPSLVPAVVHNLYLNYLKSVPDKSLLINVFFNGNLNKDGVVRSRTVDANGIQTTFPVNENGVQNFFNVGSINKQYKLNKAFQFNATIGYTLNYYRSLLILNGRKEFYKTIDLSPYIRGGINWKDIIEWNVSYSKGIYNTYYSSDAIHGLKVNQHSFNTDMVLRWPKHIVWEGSVDYRYNSQAAAGVQKNITLLNGGVTFLFLKEDKGQLKLAAFDILNQNVAVTRTSAENYINDRQINILQRYLLLTFTYNIRSFKAAKVGGKQSLFLF